MKILKSLLTIAVMFGQGGCDADTPLKDGYFRVSDGANIHYMTGGRGTAVLLVHGFYVDSKWKL